MEHKSYSERNRPMGTAVYMYDNIPQKLRNQIYSIVDASMGHDKYVDDDLIDDLYKSIWEPYELEHGKLDIFHYTITYRWRVLETLKTETNINEFLDIVEYCFRFIHKLSKQSNYHMEARQATMTPDKAIKELNERFKQNSVGYNFTDGMIIKLSNQLIHNEITLPTFNLLHDVRFANANEEYVNAQQHYKNGFNKECIAECLKAYESTLKIIFTAKGWVFNQNDTIAPLIKIAFENNLIPAYLKEQMTGIRIILSSGVGTIRNRIGGHGQGSIKTTADDHTTKFTLDLTGANIIYLIELSEIK